MSQIPEELNRVLESLKAGQTAAARAELQEFLQRNPDSEPAWYLMSMLAPEPTQQIECLRRVLRLNPRNTQARARLSRLMPMEAGIGSRPTTPAPPAAAKMEEKSASAPAAASRQYATEVPAWLTTWGWDSKPANAQAADGVQPLGGAASPLAAGTEVVAPPQMAAPAAPASPPVNETAVSAPDAATSPAPPPVHIEARPAELSVPSPAVDAVAVNSASPLPAVSARQQRSLPIIVALVVACGGLLIVGGWLSMRFWRPAWSQPGPTTPAVAADAAPAPATPASLYPTLPPTWTATVRPTVSPTPSRTARRRTPPPPPPTVDATTAAALDDVARRVAALRGLSPSLPAQHYIVAADHAVAILDYWAIDDAQLEALADASQVLSVLGLLAPDCDLVTYTLNLNSDPAGGFYIPGRYEIYITGEGSSAVSRYVYAHQYARLLLDQSFGLELGNVYPRCAGGEQQCHIIRALAAGDAALAAGQWRDGLKKSAPADYSAIADYNPPAQFVPEPDAPPYIAQDLTFSYRYGLPFVQELYDRGGWPKVNEVYAALPQTTEQVMHPPKYRAGEMPVEVTHPALDTVLGSGWRKLADGVLGEWTTYLLLGYGWEPAARLEDTLAAKAAAGWGGDKYQIYYKPATGESALALAWAGDTAADTAEFADALRASLKGRFGREGEVRAAGICWTANGQVSCVFAGERQVVWLAAPDSNLLDALWKQYAPDTGGYPTMAATSDSETRMPSEPSATPQVVITLAAPTVEKLPAGYPAPPATMPPGGYP